MTGFIRRHLIEPVRDLICPPVCLTCDVLIDENVSRICEACWKGLLPADRRSRKWRETRRRFTRGTSLEDLLACYLLDRDGRLQEIIHQMKYRGKKSLGVELGRRLGEAIRRSPVFSSAHLLVPVPLHPLKERERGYNQSEYICRGVREVTGIPEDASLLLRTRYTETQTLLTVERRKTNVLGAFAVRPDGRRAVRGRRFIIVDDVITTGATVTACASVLRSHGAGALLAASVALAV